MSIKINTTIHKSVPVISDEGLILTILMNARQTDEGGAAVAVPELLRINTIEELTDHFDIEENNAIEEQRELYVLEYLLRGGANLLVLAVTDAGVFAAADAEKLSIEEVEYKSVLVPYHFISKNADLGNLDWTVDANSSTILSKDASLLLDVLPTLAVGSLNSISLDNPKISLFLNSGLAPFSSFYGLDTGEFSVAAEGYNKDTDFVGIPASAAVALREAQNFVRGYSWQPVAGERYGVFNEFSRVFRKFTTPEKNAFQAAHVNPLVLKRGVGNLMVAQNTTIAPLGNETNPLKRRHIVNLVLDIKRQVKKISEYFLYSANTEDTWDSYQLMLEDTLSKVEAAGGLENFKVVVNRSIISGEDINNGIMRAYIEILPVGVVESIEINIAIREHSGTADVIIEGGI